MSQLKCPHCGYDGVNDRRMPSRGFRLLEDIVCWREVVLKPGTISQGLAGEVEVKTGDLKDNVLVVNSFYQTGEGYDDGTGFRIECRNCLAEFPLPEGLELEFV